MYVCTQKNIKKFIRLATALAIKFHLFLPEFVNVIVIGKLFSYIIKIS